MFLVSTGENIFRLVVVFVIFLGVLFLTVYATKWIASYQKKMTAHSNFEIVDSISVGSGQRLLIVKAGEEKYFCIGVGKEEISYLCELNKDDLSFSNKDVQTAGRDFNAILERFAKNFHSQK